MSPRVEAGKVQVASDAVLRAREISPFIVDMENNGRLSSIGVFRTQPDDLDTLTTVHIEAARKAGALAPRHDSRIPERAPGPSG